MQPSEHPSGQGRNAAAGPVFGLALAVCALTAGAGPVRLADLVREALEKNPSLQAARLRAEAARAGADGMRALDPPRLGVEFSETPLSSFPDPLAGQTETDYFLEQAIPFPGKRGARAEAERRRGEAGDGEARSLADGIVQDVKTAYYDLWLIDARLRVNDGNQGLVRRLVETARRQYEVGLGRQADILRAQAELSALQSQALSLEDARQAAVGDLNVLLDRPAESPFDTLAAFVPEPVRWGYESLRPLAQARHPGLKALDAERSMRGAELAAAGRDFLPDFMVKGAYKDMGTAAGPHGYAAGDSWSLMLAVDVPVAPWSAGRYRSGYRIAKVNLERAERERKAAANRVDADLRLALARADAAWRQWELAGDALVPQAEQALNSSLSAYQTGKGDFMALLDAYRASLGARLERDMAAAKLMRSRAELERAVGMELDSIPARPDGGGAR
ncbi:MAG TPA: TolC family protein [Fibrobacteria bacterium]|nr:TolC family protein [Fibrobacteria bacterium]